VLALVDVPGGKVRWRLNVEEASDLAYSADGRVLAHLAGITRLRKLRLPRVTIEGDGLKRLAGMTQLEELDLNIVRLPRGALTHLPKLPKLRRLNLSAPNSFGDDDLKYLTRAPNLEWLYIESLAGVRGPGLAHLLALKRLRYIHPLAHVTDEALRPLSQLPKLEQVDR